METQVQQTTNDASNPSQVPTASSPQAWQIISPTTQSIAKGRWIVTQTFVFLVGLPSYVGSFFNEYRQLIISIAVIWGVAIALRVVLAVMDALDDIPVVAPTFELIGVGYSVWFVSRYLLKASNRQELVQQTQEVLNKQAKDAVASTESQHLNKLQQDAISTIASENQQLFKPGEFLAKMRCH